ncbi:MAG: glycosyltransferase family 2 protein [Bacteroidia bacterium]
MSLTERIKNMFRPAYHLLKRSYKQVFRLFTGNSFNASNYKEIPVIINNYNRLTYPKLLIAKLESWGYRNIFILDNNSTFPPLLEYYKNTSCKVIRLKENMGYMALWKSGCYTKFKSGYYVYTDPDVLPLDSCGEDFLLVMLDQLKKYPAIEKIGLALSVHDLPDHYALKEKVIAWEKPHWEKKITEMIYDAPVDTTFALYRPLAKGNAEQCPAYRINGRYGAKHLPWYEDSANLSEEELYYQGSITKKDSYWINQHKSK